MKMRKYCALLISELLREAILPLSSALGLGEKKLWWKLEARLSLFSDHLGQVVGQLGQR